MFFALRCTVHRLQARGVYVLILEHADPELHPLVKAGGVHMDYMCTQSSSTNYLVPGTQPRPALGLAWPGLGLGAYMHT
jgi:hypothetical protein